MVWTDEYGFGSAYVGSGVEKMTNERIRIKQNGRYFLYSFVTLKSRENPGPENGSNVVHTLWRFHPKLPNLGNQLLLIGKRSLARDSEMFNTSYLGAALVLREGDEIWVDVTPSSAVYSFAPANYFGLFKL